MVTEFISLPETQNVLFCDCANLVVSLAGSARSATENTCQMWIKLVKARISELRHSNFLNYFNSYTKLIVSHPFACFPAGSMPRSYWSVSVFNCGSEWPVFFFLFENFKPRHRNGHPSWLWLTFSLSAGRTWSIKETVPSSPPQPFVCAKKD